MADEPNTISAQVVVKTDSGSSIAGETEITSKNIQHLFPSETNLTHAFTQLKEHGFSVRRTLPTLTITGTKTLFEKTFRLSFEKKAHKSGSYYVPTTQASIPSEMKDSVAAFVFPEPVEFFE